jgi:hypothetical protein
MARNPHPGPNTSTAAAAGALPLAATAGVRIERGDLRSRLTALVAEVPAQATPVVLHSATFAYLTVGDRAAAAASRLHR